MAGNRSVTGVLLWLVIGALAGCVNPAIPSGDGGAGEGSIDAPESGVGRQNSNEGATPAREINETNAIVMDGCLLFRGAISNTGTSFPFESPAGWGDDGLRPDQAVLVRAWQCESASVYGRQTFHNVSMAWIGHSNATNSHGMVDGYGYNELVAEVEVTAAPRPFQTAVSREWNVSHADVAIGLDGGFTHLMFESGRIQADVNQAYYPDSTDVSERMVFVARDGASWAYLQHEGAVDRLWFPGTVEVEGDTPLSRWFEDAPVLPIIDGGIGVMDSVRIDVHV